MTTELASRCYAELYSALFWASIEGPERYGRRKDSPGQRSLFGDEPAAATPGKHDVSQEARDQGGRWTAGGAKSEESPAPAVDPPANVATIGREETTSQPTSGSGKMTGELYSDDKRTVRVDDNGRYTIVPMGGEPREVWPFGEILPIDRAPPGVAAAVKKQGLKNYAWYGGLAMPRAAAEAIHRHYTGEQDREQAAYNATHPGGAERREINAMLARAHRMRDDNYGRATALRLDAQDKLAAWRKKYPKEAAEERADELRDAAEHHRSLAAGAMLYDADGSLSPEDQKQRASEFHAKAVELDRQAQEAGR